MGGLSGGNIQKFILARSLAGNPLLLVCNSPTYGLDVRTVRFIHELLKGASRDGAAVVLVSADLDELFACCDRIGVLSGGEMAGLMKCSEASAEKIAKRMLGT
jgi:simple sugar transport system ATP-binding protein